MSNRENPNIISDTVLVALIPGVGYLASYIYQWKFLNYFNIPLDLIELTISKVIFLALIGLGWLITLFASLLFFLDKKPGGKIKNFFINTGIFFSIFGIGFFFPLIILIVNLQNSVLAMGLLVIILFLMIILWIYSVFGKKIKISKDDIITKMENKIGQIVFPLLVICLIFLGISFALGVNNAKNQKIFPVTNTPTEFIIISNYKEGFLLLSLDRESKTFGKDITILTAEKMEREGITFSLQDVGPLTSSK